MAHQIKDYWQNYIDGKWVDGDAGGRIEIENPATATKLCEIAEARASDVDKAVAAARRAFESRVLSDMRPSARGQLMQDISRHFTEMADEIALAECLDNGKSLAGGKNEALAAARYFSYYGGAADKLEGKMIPLGAGYVDYTIPAPFGVSAQIVPWNFPLQMRPARWPVLSQPAIQLFLNLPKFPHSALPCWRKPVIAPVSLPGA